MRSRTPGLGLFTVLLTLLAPQSARSQDAAPSGEGIGVHGHWTITVVRDGDVVERREFENALTGGGRGHLAAVLAGQDTPGPWLIIAQADGTGTLCANNEYVLGTDTDCAISETTGETVVAVSGSSNDTVLLEGTETVVRDGNIIDVHTFQWRCNGQVAPSACTAPLEQPRQFTLKVLAQPIAVQAGDRIEVTVALSFGTLAS